MYWYVWPILFVVVALPLGLMAYAAWANSAGVGMLGGLIALGEVVLFFIVLSKLNTDI